VFKLLLSIQHTADAKKEVTPLSLYEWSSAQKRWSHTGFCWLLSGRASGL